MNGVTLLMDMSGMGWNHAKNINPMQAKKMSSVIQVSLQIFGCL